MDEYRGQRREKLRWTRVTVDDRSDYPALEDVALRQRAKPWITLVVVAFGIYSGTVVILWGNRAAGVAVLGLVALQLWKAKPWAGLR